jgi:hypothetical protein
MAGEPVALQAVVSSAVESAHGHSPDEIFYVEVVGELVAEFQMMDKWCSWLEWPTVRICDILLGPPPGQARPADHLDEAIDQLRAKLAAWRKVDAELEALCTLAARVWDLVLDNINGPSSLPASMSMMVELLKGQIDAAATNGVC